MKDTLTTANYRDFKQRYEGTYGRYAPDDKESMLVLISSIDGSQVNFSDHRGVRYHAVVDSGIPFEFVPVERKVVNTSSRDVLFASRRPARQWRRGICSDNTTITSLVSKRNTSINFKNIDAIFNTEVDVKEAFKLLSTGKLANIALDDKFSVIGGTVNLYDRPIGVYKDKMAQIHPLFKQEFTDMVTRNSFEIKVETYNE